MRKTQKNTERQFFFLCEYFHTSFHVHVMRSACISGWHSWLTKRNFFFHFPRTRHKVESQFRKIFIVFFFVCRVVFFIRQQLVNFAAEAPATYAVFSWGKGNGFQKFQQVFENFKRKIWAKFSILKEEFGKLMKNLQFCI